MLGLHYFLENDEQDLIKEMYELYRLSPVSNEVF
jgi:hypothetical protein